MSFSRVLQPSFCTATQSNVISSRSIGVISTDLYKERNLKRLVEKFKKSSELYRFRTKLPFTRTPYAVSPPQNASSGSRRSWRTRSSTRTSPTRDSLSDWLRFTGNLACSRIPVFDEMPEKNCERTTFDKVDEVFRGVSQKLSIEPDVVSYNTVIKAAVSMVVEMEKKGVESDMITFNTIMNGLFANGQFLAAEKIWSRMKNVVPDVRSYNARLLGLASEKKTTRRGDLDIAFELGEEIFKRQCRLVDGLPNASRINDAKKIVRLGNTNT
ncbi:pentatricopeptide repeat-containing protein [Pyrus ussuriensis x Pyrus communis]|uniref:Pentatricopeptide repeat-containing protein n=1 Tax=Pyrus ussuriensis x Pyrus communis TaxID=2448454 RepID=A0A5N5FIQ4_9ROSA|nr:pentatricopeptide repeat-containing protein [Pyrus ussuriensis x Pyrus communis]